MGVILMVQQGERGTQDAQELIDKGLDEEYVDDRKKWEIKKARAGYLSLTPYEVYQLVYRSFNVVRGSI